MNDCDADAMIVDEDEVVCLCPGCQQVQIEDTIHSTRTRALRDQVIAFEVPLSGTRTS